MSKILKKRVSLLLVLSMLIATILPIFVVNAASTIDTTLKLDGKEVGFNTTINVKEGQELRFIPSIPNGEITRVGCQIGDTGTTREYEEKELGVIMPAAPDGYTTNIYFSAGGYDQNNEFIVMEWKKVKIVYASETENTECEVDMTIEMNSQILKARSTVEVKGGEKINVSAKSKTGADIYTIGYYYYLNGKMEGDIVDISSENITITVPTGEPGTTRYLFIEAVASNDDGSANVKTKTGWVEIRLKYPKVNTPVVEEKKLALTHENKELAINSTTEVEILDTLTILGTPADKVTRIYFKWDNEPWSTVPNTSKYNIRIPTYFEPGTTHTLTIKAEYDDGTLINEQKYYFRIPDDSADITLNTKLNSKTILPGRTYEVKGGEEIVVSASATGTDVDYIKYYFGNGKAETVNKSKVSFDVPKAKSGKTVKLYVEAVGEDKSTTGVKVYTLKYVDTIDGELDIEPWMEENDEILNLAINLRNDSEEEEKANKNIYALEETVTYFIDYKNGTGDDIDSLVKIELAVPIKFDVVDAGDGVVNKKDGVITWEFENGLKEDEAGTLVVKVKYTGFSKSKYDNEVIYPSAAIFKGKREQDRSTVINLIIEEYDMEIEEVHEPYMFGDKDTPTFRPDDSISRAEGALVLARIYGLNYKNTKVTDVFSDLDETYEEAQKAIVAASKAGLINGGKDGKFRPNQPMTRAEFIKILACMVQESAANEGIEGLEIKDSESNIKNYSDSTRYYVVNGKKIYTHWALNEVTLMARLNMLPLTEDEPEIELDEEITRAEVAQLVNFYLLRAPANVTSKTKTGFEDVTRKHKLIGDIIEATREAHTFSMNEDDGTENAE